MARLSQEQVDEILDALGDRNTGYYCKYCDMYMPEDDHKKNCLVVVVKALASPLRFEAGLVAEDYARN